MQTGFESRANPEKVGGSIPPPSAKSFQRQMLHRASGAFSFSIRRFQFREGWARVSPHACKADAKAVRVQIPSPPTINTTGGLLGKLVKSLGSDPRVSRFKSGVAHQRECGEIGRRTGSRVQRATIRVRVPALPP